MKTRAAVAAIATLSQPSLANADAQLKAAVAAPKPSCSDTGPLRRVPCTG